MHTACSKGTIILTNNGKSWKIKKNFFLHRILPRVNNYDGDDKKLYFLSFVSINKMAGEMRRRGGGGGGGGGGGDSNVIKFYTDDSHGFEL